MSGSYRVEVTVSTYRNPSGRCDECQPGLDPGCCDETSIRPADQQCPSSPTCDPIFNHRYCDIDTANACEGAESTFSRNFAFDANIINVDTNFPLIVEKNEPWNVSDLLCVDVIL